VILKSFHNRLDSNLFQFLTEGAHREQDEKKGKECHLTDDCNLIQLMLLHNHLFSNLKFEKSGGRNVGLYLNIW
jgi:hypothetical protein